MVSKYELNLLYFLCDECKEHHTFLKATRCHELVSISKFKSLQLFRCDIQQSCIYHNVKYQQYTMDYTTSHVIKSDLDWLSYVSAFGDKIYYTNDNYNSVV